MSQCLATTIIAFAAAAGAAAAQVPPGAPTLSGGGPLACAMLDGRAECWGYAVHWSAPPTPGFPPGTHFGPAPLPGDPGITAVATGEGLFACGLAPGGELYCIGRNGQRRAAPFTQESRVRECGGMLCADSLVRVAAPLTFRAFAPGHQASCGVTRDGRLYCWGNNEQGLVRAPAAGFLRSPVPVLPSLRFRAVAGSHNHLCALTEDGVAWCWGAWGAGQLGDGRARVDEQSGRPTRVDNP
jgi:hypothetical protein